MKALALLHHRLDGPLSAEPGYPEFFALRIRYEDMDTPDDL